MRKLRAWLFLTLASTLGCGARSELAASFQSETEGGASTTGGTPSSAGRGGNVTTTGGSFAMGGASGTAGAFTSAGAGVAGQPGQMCTLPVSDCRTASQPECEGHSLCEGKTSYFNRVSSLPKAHVVDIATSRDRRVAIAGYFEGDLFSDVVDGEQAYLQESSGSVDAFVVSLDAAGSVEWSVAYGGDLEQRATGLDFSPNGSLIVQGVSVDQGFVLAIDAAGNELWSRTFDGGELTPGQVAVDNNGTAVLTGNFADFVATTSTAVYSQMPTPYVIRLNPDGQQITLRAIQVQGWHTILTERLAVDDEDNLILALNGYTDDGAGGVLLKQTPTGSLLYQHDVRGYFLHVSALTVDREMRVTVGGEFGRELQFSGETMESSYALHDVWLAQVDRNGELHWLRRYPGEGEHLDELAALTADGTGNLVLSGRTKASLYVHKLRSSGDPVWLRQFPVSTFDELPIAADNDHNLWLGGNFGGSFDLGTDVVAARGNVDGFVLKVGP